MAVQAQRNLSGCEDHLLVMHELVKRGIESVEVTYKQIWNRHKTQELWDHNEDK